MASWYHVSPPIKNEHPQTYPPLQVVNWSDPDSKRVILTMTSNQLYRRERGYFLHEIGLAWSEACSRKAQSFLLLNKKKLVESLLLSAKELGNIVLRNDLGFMGSGWMSGWNRQDEKENKCAWRGWLGHIKSVLIRGHSIRKGSKGNGRLQKQ